MDVVFDAPPTVSAFMCNDDFFRTICGPLGSGKTTSCIMEVGRRCIEMPPGPDGYRRSRWAIVRNTKPQLKDTTLRDWLKWWPPGQAGRWKEGESIFYLEFGDVKAEILFRALDTPDDIQRVLSLQLTGAFVDECREIHPEIINALQGRLGRFPSVGDVPEYWSGMIGSTNPPEEDSWWYKAMEGIPIEADNPDTIVELSAFHQPSGLSDEAENRQYLKADYYERIAKGKTKAWIDTYVNGLYSPSLTGVPVWGHVFNRDKHVSRYRLPIDANLPVVIGMDFGRTPAAVFQQMRPDGRVYVVRELVEFGMGLDRFISERLRPMLANTFPTNPWFFSGDPAGKQMGQVSDDSCYAMLKREFKTDNSLVKLAQTNDPDARIQATEHLLVSYPQGEPKMLIDPSCQWLIDAMRSKYRYASVKNPDFDHKARPDKNRWSHIADAKQYADLFILGGKYDRYVAKHKGAQAVMGFNPLGNFEAPHSGPALPQGY